jgi:hypothetical protein
MQAQRHMSSGIRMTIPTKNTTFLPKLIIVKRIDADPLSQ